MYNTFYIPPEKESTSGLDTLNMSVKDSKTAFMFVKSRIFVTMSSVR